MSLSNLFTDNSTHVGFPSGLIETSVEMPPDGLNGDCIIHYLGDHGEYELTVPLVNGKREGKAIIVRDGVPTGKCEYRNGVLIGDVEELDEWEPLLLTIFKNIDPSIVINSADSVLSYSIETRITRGLVRSDKRYYVIDWLRNTNRVVMADLDSKELTECVNGKRIDMPRTREVIDLDTSGKRWEGHVYSGKPYGYGVLYDEEGRKQYEGFMINRMKTCYGIDYYSDIGIVKYDGCYCYNKRLGKGILYDRNGEIEYQGLWKNDKPYSPSFDGQTIDNHTESIDIPSCSFNDVESFAVPSFVRSLRRIVIENDCFEKARLFELNGLNELESVVIGKRSFTVDEKERSDTSVRIVNCSKLKSIQTGEQSFSDYHSLELNNLPSLQSIVIGYSNFKYAPFFSLVDLPQLQSIWLDHEVFWLCYSVVFENLPKVQSIHVGGNALKGCPYEDRKTISSAPYNYKNTLTMRNLPSLTRFEGCGDNFLFIGSVILENIPKLSSSGIDFPTEIYNGHFLFTYSLQSSSTYYLISSSFDAPALEAFIRSQSEYV